MEKLSKAFIALGIKIFVVDNSKYFDDLCCTGCRECSCYETVRMILFSCDLIVPLMTRALLVNVLIHGTMSVFLERLKVETTPQSLRSRILKILFW